jgi:hypothetical protein
VKQAALALLVVLFGLAGCGQEVPSPPVEPDATGPTPSADAPAATGPQRVQVPDTEVPLFVEVQAVDGAGRASGDASSSIRCQVRLAWGDGQRASRNAPWTGAFPVGEATEVSFQLWGPRAADLDFAYLVARVTPRPATEGGIRFDIETTGYACIR